MHQEQFRQKEVKDEPLEGLFVYPVVSGVDDETLWVADIFLFMADLLTFLHIIASHVPWSPIKIRYTLRQTVQSPVLPVTSWLLSECNACWEC